MFLSILIILLMLTGVIIAVCGIVFSISEEWTFPALVSCSIGGLIILLSIFFIYLMRSSEWISGHVIMVFKDGNVKHIDFTKFTVNGPEWATTIEEVGQKLKKYHIAVYKDKPNKRGVHVEILNNKRNLFYGKFAKAREEMDVQIYHDALKTPPPKFFFRVVGRIGYRNIIEIGQAEKPPNG